jgi:hypothetical protein
MLPAESHWIHTLKRSRFTNEELRVGSFACFAHPQLRRVDLTELHVPFCAYKNSSGCQKHSRLSKPGQKLATELCLFVPAPKVALPVAPEKIWRPRRDCVSAVKAGWLNVTPTNNRNTDALDGVLRAARNTSLCPRRCDADRTFLAT